MEALLADARAEKALAKRLAAWVVPIVLFRTLVVLALREKRRDIRAFSPIIGEVAPSSEHRSCVIRSEAVSASPFKTAHHDYCRTMCTAGPTASASVFGPPPAPLRAGAAPTRPSPGHTVRIRPSMVGLPTARRWPVTAAVGATSASRRGGAPRRLPTCALAPHASRRHLWRVGGAAQL